MKKIAFVFSGQGAQYPGMSEELFKINKEAKDVFDCACEILGFNLIDTIINADKQTLLKTRIAQPAIMAVSLAAVACVRECKISNVAVCGHSLGEYAALVESGCLSLEDGFRVIKKRADIMAQSSENQDGAMCAVLGAKAEDVERICKDAQGYVEAVNYNCPGQIVIAGEKKALESCVVKMQEVSRKCTYLNVSGAFHSKLMKKAADEFETEIANIKFNDPKLDFYSNLTANRIVDGGEIKKAMVEHMMSPVRFSEQLNNMQRDGIDIFIELGPKKTLVNFVKRTLKDAITLNVEDEKSLNKTVEKLNELV